MECYGLKGAYQHPDVRIGWAPYVTTQDTEIRSDPDGGTLLKSLIKGSGVAWQSVRNPSGSPTPPLRMPIHRNGYTYVWVYSRAGTHTGWIRYDHIKEDSDSIFKPPLLGPGGFDFEIGRTLPLPKKPSSCGRVSHSRPKRKVKARETYLRYSERGTAFHYLHRGDIVQLLLVDAAHGFAFCEVLVVYNPNSGARIGTRGWIQQEALEAI